MVKIALLLCSIAAAHPHHGLKHSGGKKVDAAATPEIECRPTQQPTTRLECGDNPISREPWVRGAKDADVLETHGVTCKTLKP